MKSSIFTRLAALGLVAGLFSCVPAGAQDRPPWDVFVGWSPVFSDNVANHVLPAWGLAVSGGGTRSLTAAFDVSGRYYLPGGSNHSFLGGPRYTFSTASSARGFVQLLTGLTVLHAYGTAYGMAVVPGGGVDVPFTDTRFAFRLQGDYSSEYAPGDYDRHYWGHLWRVSTGLVFRPTN